MNALEDKMGNIFAAKLLKVVISKPKNKTAEVKKIELELKQNGYLVTKYTAKQVFHARVTADELAGYCLAYMQEDFLQMNAWDDAREYLLMISKKGGIAVKTKALPAAALPKINTTHNRQKQYIISEDTVIPPLIDMGIFTKDGKIVNAMYDKFKQINRFIELIDDAVKKENITHFNIIDFGCGKSYLTFILYYYFTEIKNISVNIVGLDLKEDVIEKCNEAAKRYGYTNLHFELGDINGYQCNFDVDMVISLHACDTATDYALYNAVRWNAKMIFSVPCCQHELNSQISTETLSLLTHYGIIQERFAALATDAIRGGILEYCGYKTQLLEFVDFAHTPKNILIRAVKRRGNAVASQEALAEVERLMTEFHFKPTLYSLLVDASEAEGLSQASVKQYNQCNQHLTREK